MIKMQTAVCSSSSVIDRLLNYVMAQPDWVKTYIYHNLRNNLKRNFDIEKLDQNNENDLVQMYVPTPSATGMKIIQRKFNRSAISFDLNEIHIKFMKSVGINKKLIDICNDNKWSLVDGCKLLVEIIERGYMESIENTAIANKIYYIAGRIRLGEYLLRMNKLSLEQIDRALVTQRQIQNNIGEPTRIGELLVNLGFINDSDKDEILQLKERSTEVCSIEDQTESLKKEIDKLTSSLESLRFENEGIKQDLMFYQDELIEKSKTIANLESTIQEKETKKNIFSRIFCFSQ